MATTLEMLREMMPEFAKDVSLNLGIVLSVDGAPGLTEKQILMSALACAYTINVPEITEGVLSLGGTHLGAAEKESARIASVTMAMNNVYYRSIHLAESEALSKLPAKLRMNKLMSHGVDKADFEAMSLAISALSGCGMCIKAHVHGLTKLGVSPEGVQSVFRIASVLQAAKNALQIAQSKS